MAMVRAIDAWLQESHLPKDTSLRLPYTTYGCMLLLPGNAFNSPEWQQVREQCSTDEFDELYKLIAKHLQITHIAINKPIPYFIGQDNRHENQIRAPQNFQPIWGNFGPVTCQSPPTPADFDAAFWVTAKQNAIHQIWAPRWTMFSRGNISEKARLLTLPSVQSAIEQGKADGRGCAAVDLFAGIGYFAFSYLRAGIDRVLCWDLNPWSTEGLRRGAAANKWSAVTNDDQTSIDELKSSKARLVIFEETNELAEERVQHLRDDTPPIRHVNCGLLPSSRASLQIALAVLDHELGGWIHVHENLAVKEIQQGAEAVRSAFQQMLGVSEHEREVDIKDIHQVKSYAPGVMHCVIDIHIPALYPG